MLQTICTIAILVGNAIGWLLLLFYWIIIKHQDTEEVENGTEYLEQHQEDPECES